MQSIAQVALACSMAINAACVTSAVEPRMSKALRDDDGSAQQIGNGRWHAKLIAVFADPDHVKVAGSATMAPGPRAGTTDVMVYILSATPMRVHPWSVRRGRCGNDKGPLVRHAIFEPLVVDLHGESSSGATLALHTPSSGAYYVAVYSASTDLETVIACGDLEPPRP